MKKITLKHLIYCFFGSVAIHALLYLLLVVDFSQVQFQWSLNIPFKKMVAAASEMIQKKIKSESTKDSLQKMLDSLDEIKSSLSENLSQFKNIKLKELAKNEKGEGAGQKAGKKTPGGGTTDPLFNEFISALKPIDVSISYTKPAENPNSPKVLTSDNSSTVAFITNKEKKEKCKEGASYGGIGVSVSVSPEGYVVTDVAPGDPAWKIGLQKGDVLLVKDLELYKGPEGTSVDITYIHNGVRLNKKTVREKICYTTKAVAQNNPAPNTKK